MISTGIEGRLCCSKYDIPIFVASKSPLTIQVGKELTKGLGQLDPDIGRDAALEDRHQPRSYIRCRHGFCYCWNGRRYRNWGSVVAQIAKEMGASDRRGRNKALFFRRVKEGSDNTDVGVERIRDNRRSFNSCSSKPKSAGNCHTFTKQR